jgi:hypothetical protein
MANRKSPRFALLAPRASLVARIFYLLFDTRQIKKTICLASYSELERKALALKASQLTLIQQCFNQS